jgi:hypothetical protein
MVLVMLYFSKFIFSSPLQKEPTDDVLSLAYDVELLQRFWQKRTGEVLRRTLDIVTVILPFISKLVVWEILIRGKIVHHEGLQV